MHDNDPRSLRWQSFFEWLMAVVVNTFLFWLAAMLVVTLPVAITATFAGMSGTIRPVPMETGRRFWQALRSTFGRSWALFLIDLLVGLLLYLDIRLFLGLGGPAGIAAAYGFGLMGILLAMINLYAWPLLAWYPRPLGRLLKHAFLLAVGHPVPALGGLVAPTAALWLLLLLPTGLNVLVLMFGPALAAYLMGRAAWQVLSRYPLPEEELTFPTGRRSA
ncbi:MAG: DUF624 domain-containing protein [Bacillota bacterium]